MTSSVDRLKELLFDQEAQRLSDVQRRIDQLSTSETERHEQVIRLQGELRQRVDQVFERAGTEDRLLKSVAQVIDGALREAEVTKHEPLSRAVAPVVVKLIKTELKNSQKELVAAIYPMTGAIVKQYVQAAMADLTADINRRLGGKQPSDIEARAKDLGITVAQLAFIETQALKVDELFLVKRGSGDLIAHWERPLDDAPAVTPEATARGSNRDVLIAGYLTGITAFSEEAFDEQKSSLRAIDMDGQRIFVRASPAVLLAARVSGRAPQSVERIIDDEFVKVLAAYQETDKSKAGDVDALLTTVSTSLGDRFEAERRRIDAAAREAAKPPGVNRLYILAAAILLPLIALIGWQTWRQWQSQRVADEARAIVAADPALRGFPITLAATSAGSRLLVSGLTPSAEARARLADSLRRAFPAAVLEDTTGVLPAVAVQPAPVTPSARQRLDAFTRDHAIFFGNGAELVDERAALATLETLAGLLRDNRALVRLVGYTDDRGGDSAVNQQIAQARADRVAELLVSLGIGRDRFIAIGRSVGPDVSRMKGPGNPNRRVVFELGYIGEPVP
jgi:outer membrane protein OmpA-like peptidoglycan-associated protein